MSNVSYTNILSSYRKQGDDKQVFVDLINSIDKNDLKSAVSCISIGPGPGEIEIKFIQLCMPSLEKFIAIEKDPNCAAELTSNLASQIPNMKTEVHQEVAQNWTGPESPVDVILMFHCLYYLDRPERLKLLKKCFNSWLKPGGTVYVMMIKDEKEGENHVMNQIYRALNVKCLTEAYEIKEDIQMLGLSVGDEYLYQNNKDLSNVDDEFVGFIKFHINEHIEDSTIKEAIKKVAPDGKGYCVGSLFSVKTEKKSESPTN